MESPTTKRPKMSERESNESAQTSSATQTIRKPNASYSTYDYHYNNPYYVDKSLLIKEVFEVNHLLITAPSRFGKTLNMDMVKRFVEIELDDKGNPIVLDVDKDYLHEIQPKSKNFKLFKGKKIFEDKKFVRQYFGQYPTIYVDFTRVKGDNFEQILVNLRKVIRRAFEKHPYLLKSDLWNSEEFDKEDFMDYYNRKRSKSLTESELEEGLAFLAKVLHSYYKGRKVFVFIDEFDVPVNAIVYNNEMNSDDKKKTINLLQNIITDLLKENIDYVERSLSNACHQLSGILSNSANNVIICRFLTHKSFGEFYGFQQTEVESILQMAGLYKYFEDVKAMYDGYEAQSTRGGIPIYSPWAILNYIYYEKLDTYWRSRIPLAVTKQIGHSKIRSEILKMKSGELVEIKCIEKLEIEHIHRLCNIINLSIINDNDIHLFFQFLFELGLFGVAKFEDDNLWLTLPNNSVRKIIDEHIYTYDSLRAYYNHSDELIDKFIESIRNVARSCDENSVRNLAKSIEIMYKEGGYLPENEQEFREGVVAYMRQHFRKVKSECITSKRKRCDNIVFVEELKTVFEFEWKVFEKTSSEGGHEQIFKKGYDTLLEDKSLLNLFRGIDIKNVKQKLYFGVHFGSNCETSITWSLGPNDKRKTVCSSDA